MAISDASKANFETLQRATANGDLALMECTDKETGKPVTVVCAVFVDGEGMVNMIPLAKMFDGNPYDELVPPTEEAA